MTSPIIITGTDTGIGKTVFAAALTSALNGHYWKPVQAGIDGETDTEEARRLSGLPAYRFLPEAYRLTTACSPHRAAQIDGVSLEMRKLAVPVTPGPLIIEGAGGVLVPLRDDLLSADLFARWGLPVVIVARTSLGTINHSLLCVEALRARRVSILGIAFVGTEARESQKTIASLGKVKNLGRLPFLDPLDAKRLSQAFADQFRVEDFRL